MKKIFLIIAIVATAFAQNTFAQDTAQPTQQSLLLHSYYNIKDALIAGKAGKASLEAATFVKQFNKVDSGVISQDISTALLKDAIHISESKDIKHQREHFADFSTNMFALAKSVKLTSDPIYEVYCPMKKAYWLSNNKAIKNPYFGSAMLTCGSIKETLR
ncbi:hypothetical protein BH09BAC2_BH09BAC2_15450 [soil metagenome]